MSMGLAVEEYLNFGGGRDRTFTRWLCQSVGAVALASLFFGAPLNALAIVVTDDFSDMNDTANPAWTHLDGFVASTGQTWDASTGVYRLYAPSNGIDLNNRTIGFVGAHVGNEFTDVRVSMDLVEFYTTVAFPNSPEFVNVMARSNGNNDAVGLTGYAYGYDPLANANQGEMVLYRNDVGDPTNDIGSQRVTLDQTKDYRVVLEVIGNTIHGKVTEIATGNLVAESFANISAAQNVYTSGTSGVYGYTGSPFETRFAIDNFRTEEALAGDYTRDGAVDTADYVLWRDTLGEQSPNLALPTDDPPGTFEVVSFGDMRANGAVSGACGYDKENCEVINQADYEVWTSNFGRTISGSGIGSGAAVPEPASAALVLMGLAILCLDRRNTR
jgi:hypothetical protein